MTEKDGVGPVSFRLALRGSSFYNNTVYNVKNVQHVMRRRPFGKFRDCAALSQKEPSRGNPEPSRFLGSIELKPKL